MSRPLGFKNSALDFTFSVGRKKAGMNNSSVYLVALKLLPPSPHWKKRYQNDGLEYRVKIQSLKVL
jgi:hypothetical protein